MGEGGLLHTCSLGMDFAGRSYWCFRGMKESLLIQPSSSPSSPSSPSCASSSSSFLTSSSSSSSSSSANKWLCFPHSFEIAEVISYLSRVGEDVLLYSLSKYFPYAFYLYRSDKWYSMKVHHMFVHVWWWKEKYMEKYTCMMERMKRDVGGRLMWLEERKTKKEEGRLDQKTKREEEKEKEEEEMKEVEMEMEKEMEEEEKKKLSKKRMIKGMNYVIDLPAFMRLDPSSSSSNEMEEENKKADEG